MSIAEALISLIEAVESQESKDGRPWPVSGGVRNAIRQAKEVLNEHRDELGALRALFGIFDSGEAGGRG